MDLICEIKNIKNISKCKFVLPVEKGIYCLAGTNGCGKSTALSCLAQTVFSSSLQNMSEHDYSANSSVEFSYGNTKTIWNVQNGSWLSNSPKDERIHFNGMYEGSLFYGTRFADSLVVDDLVKNSVIRKDDIVDADEYVKNNMSYILHGDYEHYKTLKRVRNKTIAQKVHLRNTPYFEEINENLISQYKMSSGECLLVSLLHFIYNALIRRSLPINKPILMLIDEIELALHPVAVSRLIDLLNGIIKEHDTLTVMLTTHSPEVIRKISPSNIYFMENDNSVVTFSNPCYPSYAIRDVYMHTGFDYVILVEDLLAKYVVDKIIQRKSFGYGKLINVLPVGGWENVLKFQTMSDTTNTFGIGTKVFSILDGDIVSERKIQKEYKKTQKMFLPINSIEKFLLNVCTDSSQKTIKREINDTFFSVQSMNDILADYNKTGDNSGKALYRKLVANLEKRGISEDAFIINLCEIIIKNIDFTDFTNELSSRLNK